MTLKNLSFGLFEKVTALVVVLVMGLIFVNRTHLNILIYVGISFLITLLFGLLNTGLLKKYNLKTKLLAFLAIVVVEVLVVMLYNKGFNAESMIANMGNLEGVNATVDNQGVIGQFISGFVPLYFISVLFSVIYSFISKKERMIS